MKHNSLGEKPIPIVVVLKAMGCESDQEIVQLVGSEPDMMEIFTCSLEEPYVMGIYTQQQVIHLSYSIFDEICIGTEVYW